MKRHLLFISFVLFSGCYGLKLPESTENPNNPNRGPILITPGEIEYPDLAQRVSIEGIVEVELTIDTSGRVKDVDIVKRKFNSDAVYTTSRKIVYIKDIVDAPTINFYKQCKYLPALQNGKPIESIIHTGMNFKLVK